MEYVSKKLLFILFIVILLSLFLFTAPGTWKMGFKNDSFLGYWEGKLHIMGQELDFQVELIEEDHDIKGYISIPLQMMKDYPLSSIELNYPEISFNLTQGGVTAAFAGKMDEDGFVDFIFINFPIDMNQPVPKLCHFFQFTNK